LLIEKYKNVLQQENTKMFCSKKIQKHFAAEKYKNILKNIAHRKIHNVFLQKNTKAFCS
jgi:hypothetical protein